MFFFKLYRVKNQPKFVCHILQQKVVLWRVSSMILSKEQRSKLCKQRQGRNDLLYINCINDVTTVHARDKGVFTAV